MRPAKFPQPTSLEFCARGSLCAPAPPPISPEYTLDCLPFCNESAFSKSLRLGLCIAPGFACNPGPPKCPPATGARPWSPVAGQERKQARFAAVCCLEQGWGVLRALAARGADFDAFTPPERCRSALRHASSNFAVLYSLQRRSFRHRRRRRLPVGGEEHFSTSLRGARRKASVNAKDLPYHRCKCSTACSAALAPTWPWWGKYLVG